MQSASSMRQCYRENLAATGTSTALNSQFILFLDAVETSWFCRGEREACARMDICARQARDPTACPPKKKEFGWMSIVQSALRSSK
jgi:hypothetical protein